MATDPNRAPAADGTILRVALCQCNLPVGDLAGNLDRLRDVIARASDRGADLTVFPELPPPGTRPRTCC